MDVHDWVTLAAVAVTIVGFAVFQLLGRRATSVTAIEQCDQCSDHWKATAASADRAERELVVMREQHLTRWHPTAPEGGGVQW